MTVGTKIDVGGVVTKATNLLRANPSIMLISLIPAIPSLIGDVATSSAIFNPVAFLATIASAILSVIASGAYVPVVKEAVAGQRLTISEALGLAYKRFWSLFAAGILVVIIVFLGLIAIVVPGIIFAAWYAYTTPAIMLENKGAMDGMSASKAFGRDKKWSTFLIFLTFVLAYAIIGIIGSVLALGGGGRVISTLIDVPLGAWTSVVISYVYITHGPSASGSASASAAPQPMWQQPQPETAAPMAPATASRFCSNCGSSLREGARFCGSCGKAV